MSKEGGTKSVHHFKRRGQHKNVTLSCGDGVQKLTNQQLPDFVAPIPVINDWFFSVLLLQAKTKADCMTSRCTGREGLLMATIRRWEFRPLLLTPQCRGWEGGGGVL